MDYFYFQGGIRGVIWADVFQAVVLLTGLLAIIIKVNFFLTNFTHISNIKLTQRGNSVSFFLHFGMCSSHLQALMLAGGFEKVFEVGGDWGRLNFFV